jgi:phage-related protein
LAVVGEAHIIVRAITDGVKDDIKRGFSGGGTAGRRAGESIGQAFKRGFNDGAYKDKSIFSRLSAGLRTAFPDAERVANSFRRLTRISYILGPALSILGQTIYSAVGGLVALGGSVLAAVPSLMALVSAFVAVKVASSIAKFALGGIGKAVSQAAAASAKAADREKAINDAKKRLARVVEGNIERLAQAEKRLAKASINLAKATRQAYEEIQQLGFSAEEAAIAEKRAAMELEDARTALARVQDLPPNSRARKEAELAFAEAELNLRKAKDQVSDLAEEQDKYAKDGIKANEGFASATEEVAEAEKNLTDTIIENKRNVEDAVDGVKEAQKQAAASDPYAGLTKSQKDFALFLFGIRGKLDELKEAAAKGFLPVLETQMDRLMKNGFFDVLKQGFADAGVAMGMFVTKLADAFSEPKSQEDLAAFFSSLKTILPIVGEILGNVFKSFLSLLKASGPATERFLNFINKNTGAFADFLGASEADGTLQTFFDKSEAMAEKILGVFGNVFKGIGGIIMTNLDIDSPGGRIVEWLDKITGQFAVMSEQPGFADSMDAMATNFIAIGDFVIGLAKSLGGLAVNTSVAEFFNKLTTGGLPILEGIVTKLGDVGPVLADFIIAFLELIDIFTDTEAPSTFFQVLTDALNILNGFLKNETTAGIIGVVSQVFAFTSAISLIGEVGKKAFDVVIGNIIGISDRFDQLKKAQGIVKEGFGKIGAVWKSGPWGKIAIILGVIIAAFVALYNTNEEFRAAVDTAWKSIQDAFGQAMAIIGPVLATIGTAFGDLMKSLSGGEGDGPGFLTTVVTFLAEGIQKLAEFIAPLLPMLGQFVADGLTALFDIIQKLAPVFMDLVEKVLPIFKDLFEQLAPIFADLIEQMVPIIQDILPVFKDLFEQLAPIFADLMKTLGPLIGQVIKALIPAFMGIMNAIMPLIPVLITALVPIIKILADVFAAVVPIIVDIVKQLAKFLGPILVVIGEFIAGIAKQLPGMFKLFMEGFKNVINFIRPIVNAILGGIEGFVNGIIDGLNFLIKGVNKIKFKVPDWVPFIGGNEIKFTIPEVGKIKLPRLAQGGTVMPSPGGTIAQIAEAGRPERVEPLDPSGLSKRDRAMIEMLAGRNMGGGQGVTVNVYPSAGMDERDLAEMVSRKLQLMMRRGATT